jgi:hypothetical protein
MKAVVKVGNRAQKLSIEAALADPRIVRFLSEYGSICLIQSKALRLHAMSYYDGVLGGMVIALDKEEVVGGEGSNKAK